MGDDALANVYAGFYLLVRENLALGALKDWEISPEQRDSCRCNSQFTSKSCWPLRITASDQVPPQSDSTTGPHACLTGKKSYSIPHWRVYGKDTDRFTTTVLAIPHAFLPITGSPITKNAHEKFHRLLAQGTATGRKNLFPVIQGLSHSTSYSRSAAQASMDEWLAMAKTSGRNAPFLWVGPTAPGHQKKPVGNDDLPAVWQYAIDTTQVAQSKDIDVLGMYNATLQADSWDGTYYGEKVALMQAMMVIQPPQIGSFFGTLFSNILRLLSYFIFLGYQLVVYSLARVHICPVVAALEQEQANDSTFRFFFFFSFLPMWRALGLNLLLASSASRYVVYLHLSKDM